MMWPGHGSVGSIRFTLAVLIVIVEVARQSTEGVRWLSIASPAAVINIQAEDECDHLVGLVRKQKQICRKNVEMMEAVKTGAAVAIQECQFQFTNRRWNCSTIDAVSVFGKIHNSGIREMAFVHAISSAGVAHAVTRACSSGALDRCGCDKTVGDRMAMLSVAARNPHSRTPSDADRLRQTRSGTSQASKGVPRSTGVGVPSTAVGPGFEWDGCSDNVAYGSAFAKLFVDAREKARGREASRALMNLHNNNAGRRAVEDEMIVHCKCHGVSGSCELKTCWRSLAPFRNVGERLKEKYNGAAEVRQKLVGGTRRELMPVNEHLKAPTDADLVYLDESPDFCEPDVRTGSLGTRGRTCNRTSLAPDGCDLMCCGRGYEIVRRRIVERCRCKFHWCCTVKCEKCRRTLVEYVCR